jgi:hypothetical protein
MSQLVSFLDSKTPSEIVAVSLEFNKVLTTIDTIDSVTISVVSGTDANVSTMLLNSPVKVGTIVTQLIRNGVDGNMYLITGNVTSGNEKYSLAGYLPIVSYK